MKKKRCKTVLLFLRFVRKKSKREENHVQVSRDSKNCMKIIQNSQKRLRNAKN